MSVLADVGDDASGAGGLRRQPRFRSLDRWVIATYGVEMFAACIMGNHLHCDILDRRGNRPNFKNSVHSNLARGLNALRGRYGSMFATGGSCDTVTPSDEDTLNDLAYTDTNPVSAGVVKWGHLWPWFTTYGWRFGETRRHPRPSWYFDPENPDNPDVVAITRVRPKIFLHLTDDELFDKLMVRCRELEHAKQAQMEADNRRFMGLKKLARSKWWIRVTSWENRFETKPTVASSDKWKRIAALQKNLHWAHDWFRAAPKPAETRNCPVDGLIRASLPLRSVSTPAQDFPRRAPLVLLRQRRCVPAKSPPAYRPTNTNRSVRRRLSSHPGSFAKYRSRLV